MGEYQPASAAQVSLDYETNGYSDWYLPARDELKILFSNLYLINKTISNQGNGDQIMPSPGYSNYWSSSESDSQAAILYGDGGSPEGGAMKSFNSVYVRAIRAF